MYFLKKNNSDLHCRRYTEEEFFNGDADSNSESSSEESESDEDEEWRKTPMGKRINKERRSIATALPEKAAKRKRAPKLGIVAEEGDEEDEAKPRKRASGTGGNLVLS